MRRLMTFVALAMLLVGVSLVVGSYDPVRAYGSDRFDRRIEIINDTNRILVEVNSTHVDRNDWGRNLLGRYRIRPGTSLIINVEDHTGYCRYDFQAVFGNGATLVRYGINVCEASYWRLRGRV